MRGRGARAKRARSPRAGAAKRPRPPRVALITCARPRWHTTGSADSECPRRAPFAWEFPGVYDNRSNAPSRSSAPSREPEMSGPDEIPVARAPPRRGAGAAVRDDEHERTEGGVRGARAGAVRGPGRDGDHVRGIEAGGGELRRTIGCRPDAQRSTALATGGALASVPIQRDRALLMGGTMSRLAALALVLIGCSKQQPAAPQAPVVDVQRIDVAPVDTGVRSATAPDLAAIPEGTGWSCMVQDTDGGMRDDSCRRTNEACEAARTRVSLLDAESQQLARRLGVRLPPLAVLHCVASAEAHCITYVDTRDSQTHWDCSRTLVRCSARRSYFREENSREGSVVRYRSISDCELVR